MTIVLPNLLFRFGTTRLNFPKFFIRLVSFNTKDIYLNDRQEYQAGNPFVHKITQRATYHGIDFEQVSRDDLDSFEDIDIAKNLKRIS